MNCKHRPPCPDGTSRWTCGQRTRTENAIDRGLITREAALSLMQKYHVPLSPASRVYKGEQPITDHYQQKLV